MATIQDDILKNRKEALEKQLEADRLERLVKEYPDLKKVVGRWNKVTYSTASVNDKVDHFDKRHNCGCCNDSPLEIWPYIETPNGNVYSDPPKFTVGEQHWISGDKPHSGWDDAMRKAGISESIIKRVEVHFENCRQERRAAAEEE